MKEAKKKSKQKRKKKSGTASTQIAFPTKKPLKRKRKKQQKSIVRVEETYIQLRHTFLLDSHKIRKYDLYCAQLGASKKWKKKR